MAKKSKDKVSYLIWETKANSKYMKQKYRNKLGLMKINIVVRCIVFKSVRFVTLRPKEEKNLSNIMNARLQTKDRTENLEFLSRPSAITKGQQKEKQTHTLTHFAVDIATAINDSSSSNQKIFSKNEMKITFVLSSSLRVWSAM